MLRPTADSEGASQPVTLFDSPTSERPRERLLQVGDRTLSDAELVAVILQTGAAGRPVLRLAQDLLLSFAGLEGLFSASATALCAVSGIGPAKAARLQAVSALSLRRLAEQQRSKDVLTSSAATRDYLRLRYRSCPREIFVCLFLNNQHHVVKAEELFQGTIDGAAVYPREVVRQCLLYNAAAVIFAHNHPSGVAEPSQADISITARLRRALETIEVRVLDHLVIGADSVVSLAERDLL